MNYIERLQILFRKKFKIYNEKTGEITDPFTFYHLHGYEGECNAVLYDKTTITTHVGCDWMRYPTPDIQEEGINPDIRILLFTGKNDINNEGLYETDIVKDNNNKIYVIIYDEYHASFMLFSNNSDTKIFLHKFPIEKIGNLYTDPELIKGE